MRLHLRPSVVNGVRNSTNHCFDLFVSP